MKATVEKPLTGECRHAEDLMEAYLYAMRDLHLYWVADGIVTGNCVHRVWCWNYRGW